MEKEKKRDNRKVWLFLPLLVLPFLLFAFYTMEGGKGIDEKRQAEKGGINTELPDASFRKKNEPSDKMGFYRETGQTEEKQGEGMEDAMSRLGFSAKEDPKAKEIDEKLKAIQKEIDRPEVRPEKAPLSGITESPVSISPTRPETNGEIDRLEMLMKAMQEDGTEDEEVDQLNGLLQTILDIQHPGRVKEKLKEGQQIEAVEDSVFRAIPAIIADKQKVVQGATVRLKLQDSMTIDGLHIPKGFDVFATCRIANQRLMLDIRNIRFGTSIIPVNLSVYGLDGMPGLYAPEVVLTEAANLGTDNLVSGMGMYGLDQSIAGQVAGAGMDAARSMISKKVRKIKVKLKAGEPVLLKDNDLKKR